MKASQFSDAQKAFVLKQGDEGVPVVEIFRRAGIGQATYFTLERVCRNVGYPKTIRVDQGPEFVSRDLDLWAYAEGVTLDFSRPGKPQDKAFIEALNGRFRAECLNQHWLLTLADAREKMEDWPRDYNEVRPHVPSAIRCRSH
ncbi:transposase InsO family protein [Rhizobium redzepovicii]